MAGPERVACWLLLLNSLVGPAVAHRLDEYLQATLIGVTRQGVSVEIQLTPGVAMLPVLMATVDRDGDGRISTDEWRAYSNRVAHEVELQVDGVPAALSIVESAFPDQQALREGVGTIRLKLWTGQTGDRVHFENRHMPQVSAYLVNCLATPGDGLLVSGQKRDHEQRSMEFRYSFGGNAWHTQVRFWPVAIGILLVMRMTGLLYRKLHG